MRADRTVSRPVGHYGLGLARYYQGEHAEAIPPLETVAAAGSREPTLYFVLAVCYEKTGQYEKAYDAYRSALEAGLSGDERRHAEERRCLPRLPDETTARGGQDDRDARLTAPGRHGRSDVVQRPAT